MASISQLKELTNTRLYAILAMGFASGLPLPLTNSTLQAWFTEAHVTLMTIGALSLLGLPYTLKFLWAPLFDQYRIPGFDKRRGWILLGQLGAAISLLVLANMNPSNRASAMGIVALCIAFFSASQDAAINAYQTDILYAKERGLGAAYNVFAYRMATLFGGGLALIFADYMGWKWTYTLMSAVMFICMLLTYLAPRAKEHDLSSQSLSVTIAAALKDLLQREKIVLLICFIIFYKLGDALALQLMTNFLLHTLNFSLSEIGIAYKLMGFIATIAGTFIGGLYLLRSSLFSALLFFGFAQAFSNLMFVILAMAGKNFALMAAAIFIENFCSGLSTTAFLAFLMSLCNHRYTASQFALLSAAASIGRVFLGPLASMMVMHLGWTQFYAWAFILSFPGILFLLLLRDRVLFYAPATQ